MRFLTNSIKSVKNVRTGSTYIDIIKPNVNLILLFNFQHLMHTTCTLLSFAAITFEVSPPNRYKLAKNYRTLKEKHGHKPEDPVAKKELELAKAAAQAEEQDNRTEHERLRGKRLRYGEVIQLRHSFTNKYIHVSTVDMSQMEHDKMRVFLEDHESKNAQFRILPTCKVKVEGELVEVLDQIVLESFKSAGTCLTMSNSFEGVYGSICELNVGVDRTAFTLLKNRHNSIPDNALSGGSVVRFYHKDLEAYLVSEGIFSEQPTEDVHFRIRETDPMEARTLYPSKSGITYWQVEDARSIIIGDPIKWTQPVRLRHMTTRLYLRNSTENGLSMTSDTSDPLTEFRIVSVVMRPELEEVDVTLNVRMEHIATGTWLHGARSLPYERKQVTVEQDKRTKETVTRRWDGATLLQAVCCEGRQYPDAFSFQVVNEVDWRKFNYVAGMVPMLRALIQERLNGAWISAHRAHTVCQGLKEVKNFMLRDGNAVKDHQKLLRNLRVTDMLVEYLMIDTVHDDTEYESKTSQINRSVYEALRAFSSGASRKNALYLAKHIKFLRRQLGAMGGVGIQCSLTMIDLIHDNRAIVDCMREKDINLIIKLLSQIKHHTFLDLLAAMCVCNGVAMTENQIYIAKLLSKNKDILYYVEPGSMTGDKSLSPNMIYVSKSSRKKWLLLHKFVFKGTGSTEGKLFLESQMELAKKLVYGNNPETVSLLRRVRKMFDWNVTFACLKAEVLPDFFRAKYADFVTDYFVDPENTQHSVINENPETFMFHEIKTYKPGKNDKEGSEQLKHSLADDYPGLKLFLQTFLQENSCMIASQSGRNLLLERVLRIVNRLVMKGYLGTAEEIRWLSVRACRLVNGKNDLPHPVDHASGSHRKGKSSVVSQYRNKERFLPGEETSTIIAAKVQCLELLELMLKKEFKDRITNFIEKFKDVEEREHRAKKHHILGVLMRENAVDCMHKTSTVVKKRLSKLMGELTKPSEVFEKIPDIMFDLTFYNDHDLIVKSQHILNKYFNSEVRLLEIASRCVILKSEEMMGMNTSVLADVFQLRLMSKSTLNPERTDEIITILYRFAKFLSEERDATCIQVPFDHCYVAQNLQINHGALDVILQILMQDMHGQYEGHTVQTEAITQHCLTALSVMARDNVIAQSILYSKLDALLAIQFSGKELALLLTQIFERNINYCIRIQEVQVAKIVNLAGETKIPEFIELLKAIILVKGIAMKRNQLTCTKKIMQSYKTSAYVLGLTAEERETILVDDDRESERRYLVALVDVLATCAQGGGQYAESMCQTLLSMDEIIQILNNRSVDIKYKIPFAKYLTYGYIKSSKPPIQTGTIELPHKKEMWQHFCYILRMLQRARIEFDKQKNERRNITIEDVDDMSFASDMESGDEDESLGQLDLATVTAYILQGASPMTQMFFSKYYKKDTTMHPEETDILKKLSKQMLIFGIKTVTNATDVQQVDDLQECIQVLFTKSKGNFKKVEALHEQSTLAVDILKMGKELQIDTETGEMKQEREINIKLLRFASMCKKYVVIMSNERQDGKDTDTANRALPEGEMFKRHFQSYIRSRESKPNKRYKKALKLIDALEISTKRFKKKASDDQEELDLKCLQLLRATIQHMIDKLPNGWEDNLSSHRKLLKQVYDVQDIYCDFGIVKKVVPLLARTNPDISMEVLCLLDSLLFNANRKVQTALIQYFQSTCEEMFFQCVRHKLQMAIHAIKERRSMETQKTRQKEKAQAEQKKLDKAKTAMEAQQKRGVFSDGILDLSKVDRNFLKKSSTAAFRKLASSKRLIVNAAEKAGLFIQGTAVPEGEDVLDEDLEDMLEMKRISRKKHVEEVDTSSMYTDDESSVYIIFRVLAGLCDGQNKQLQDYLRHQPDNLKSYDLVSEISQFVSVLYSNITGNTIDLLALVFETLNELSQGNQENRAVLINNKVIDFVNFILRKTSFNEDCTPDQIIQLRINIANFLRSLVEENSPEALRIAREIAETLDVETFRRVMTHCHRIQTGVELDFAKVISGNWDSKTPKNLFGLRRGTDKALRESASTLGMLHYQVLARLHDVDRSLDKKGISDPNQKKAFDYYKKGCMSIELIKDDHLQRVHFRVRNKELIREEIKELVKWNIDRTSPSNKLRDLVGWSKEILKDIDYQKKILSNPIVMQLAKKWSIWNYLCILISIMINLLMLVCWDAKFTFDDIPENATELPDEIRDIDPKIWCGSYLQLQQTMGYIHNACAVMLVFCYFLLKHPKLPDFKGMIIKLKKKLRRKKEKSTTETTATSLGPLEEEDDDDDDDEDEDIGSALQYKVFGFDTLYYLGLTASSFAGTFYLDYFFAFHLLNIVANNQLLKNVVKAVTQNGASLLWVGVMGVIIIYIYALIAFAFFRAQFNPEDEMYCNTLAECTVTVLRYGAAASLTDKMALHELAHGFTEFSYITIYQLTFFILFTTIGLNVIFGIIVDTFSELRDLKWMAEKDMRSNCFICSRDSYDFESAAQGMNHHVLNDHNMWAYIYYFIYLNEIKENDYTSVDLYVSKMLAADKLDFFPLNRAMCLLNIDDDDNDNVLLDEATQLMKEIKQKQDMIIKLKLREEKERHGRKIKLDIFLPGVEEDTESSSGGPPDDDDSRRPPGAGGGAQAWPSSGPSSGQPNSPRGNLQQPRSQVGSTSSSTPKLPILSEIPKFHIIPSLDEKPKLWQGLFSNSQMLKPPEDIKRPSLTPSENIAGFLAPGTPSEVSLHHSEDPSMDDRIQNPEDPAPTKVSQSDDGRQTPLVPTPTEASQSDSGNTEDPAPEPPVRDDTLRRPPASLDLHPSDGDMDTESYDTSLPPSASQTGRVDNDA